MPTIHTFPNSRQLAEQFAANFSDWLNQVPQDRKASVALSGGSTPKQLFELWGSEWAESIDWNRIHFFWGDERCVAPDDPESNFGVAHEVWLSRVAIDPSNIHRVFGESDPEVEAIRYGNEILKQVRIGSNAVPQFDMILLGMGTDGHTASIFPNQMELLTSNQVCAVATHPETGQKRITLTGTVINNAAKAVFLVTGANKAEILQQIFEKTGAYQTFPAAHIQAQENVFYLDEAAAKRS